MSSGKQGPPTGLAKQFAEFVQRKMAEEKWSYDYLAENMSMSRNYLYTRVAQQSVFTLRDFEDFAKFIGLDPAELLVRVRLPLVKDFEGRLVPAYGVTGDDTGVHIYRTVDADPPLRAKGGELIEGRFGVGGATEDLREVAFETVHEHSEDTDDKYDA